MTNVYRAEFMCRSNWNDPAQQDDAIKEAASRLRAMADLLEARRADDIVSGKADDTWGLQGWWGSFGK